MVESCVQHPEFFCIHGPPGTGKTTTIAAVINEFAKRDLKILVTCPSNAAVDVLLERTVKMNVKVRRLGHPARTSPHLRPVISEKKKR